MKNASAQTISSNIRNMLKSNILCKKISIHRDFPIEVLNEALKPYLYVYLLSLYSYDRNKKDHNYYIINEKLKNFYRYNKLFGRKIYKKQYSVTEFGKLIYTHEFNTKHLPFAAKPIKKIEHSPIVFSDTESDEENESIYEDKSEDEREDETPQANRNNNANRNESEDEREDDEVIINNEDDDNGDDDSSVTLRTSDTMSIDSR
jgi:hypothetical protein